MSALDTLLTVEAYVSGFAQRRALVRHRHLDPAPMVVVAYRMAGEEGAPLGLMYGADPSAPTVRVAPEPRNRDMRFRELFEPFAEELDRWLAQHSHRDDDDRCISCPQILVPNRGSAAFVGSVFGRSLRYLRSTEDFPISDLVVTLGAQATWFGQQAEIPGSSVLLAATDLLRRHWATGQSSLEDEDLHVQLAWIDPPDGQTGRAAAAGAEQARAEGRIPAAGPTPGAAWDRDVYDPLLEDFNHTRGADASAALVERVGGPIAAAVSEALAPTWEATWRAHELLMQLPEGGSVADRWDSDRTAWSRHVDRIESGTAFFRTKDSARQSAWMIKSREDAQQALDLGEVLDDPMALAGLVASGEAIHGDVRIVNTDNMELPPGGRKRVRRPVLTMELPDACHLPLGTTVRWTDRIQVETEIVRISGVECDLKVTAGMRGDLPMAGTEAAFIAMNSTSYPSPQTVPGTPWTHVGADTPERGTEVPE